MEGKRREGRIASFSFSIEARCWIFHVAVNVA